MKYIFIFWIILAIFYLVLSIENYIFYKKTKLHIGAVAIARAEIMKRAGEVIDLAGAFASMAKTNFIGFLLASFAAVISLFS